MEYVQESKSALSVSKIRNSGPHVSDTLVIAPSNFSLCVIIHL